MRGYKSFSYLIGLVSLFYWIAAWFVPAFRLVDNRGHPTGGLGVLFSIFNEKPFLIAVIALSIAFLVSIRFAAAAMATKIIYSILFGIWIMLASSYLIISWIQLSISPNLILTIGYCCAIWLDLSEKSKGLYKE